MPSHSDVAAEVDYCTCNLIDWCSMTLQNGLIWRQFSWWHHFIWGGGGRGNVTISAIFKVFWHFQSLCFSQIVTYLLKSTIETLSLTFLENFLIDRQCWVSQNASDVSYSNGLKTPTKMVHEVVALPKHWQVWTHSEDLENLVVKLWQLIVLPPPPPPPITIIWYDICQLISVQQCRGKLSLISS